jgi:hypothetical protein
VLSLSYRYRLAIASLSPNTELGNTYDPANPSASYGTGWLACFGVTHGWGGWSAGWSIAEQSANDETLLGYSVVELADQTISDLETDVYGRSCLRIIFRERNVSTEKQYLMLFALRGIGSPTAQFFVNGTLVDTEEVGSNEQVAILFDCPGDDVWTTVYVRVASSSYNATIGFSGVDIYLL